MKKVQIIILIILLLTITACNSKKDNLQTKIENKIIQKINDTENISSNEILTSINYIKNNYKNIKKNTKEQEKCLEYATYLEKIGLSSENLKNHLITKLGTETKKYCLNLNNKRQNSIKDLLSQIDEKQNDLIIEFYNIYHKENTMKRYFKEAQEKIKNKAKEKDFINETTINKYLNYLIDNYKNPLRNSEVTEKTTYYLEYFLLIGKNKNCVSNNIINFSKYTKEYYLTNDIKYLEQITKELDKINSNKKELVKDLNDSYYK